MAFKVGDKVKLLPLKQIQKIYNNEYYGTTDIIDNDPYGISCDVIEKHQDKTLIVTEVKYSFNENHGMDIKFLEDRLGCQWPQVWFCAAEKQLEFAF